MLKPSVSTSCGVVKHERQRHLHDDERAAGAMPLAAGARRPPAAAQARRHMRTGVLEDWNRTEEEARDDRDRQREYQHRRVDGDVIEPREVTGREGDEQTDRAERDGESGDTSDETEDDALGKQFVRDPSAARAKRRPDRQLLLAALRALEQQVRHVRAGDQQHEADGPHQYPQHRADVANDLSFQQPQVRLEPGLLEHLHAVALERREPGEADRDQPCDVCGCLLERGARLQARDPGVIELTEKHLRAIEPHRQNQRRLPIEEPE
jgi:hypothetical protein